MNFKSILSVAETYYKMSSGIKEDDTTATHDIELTPDKDNLAAQDAQSAQKKQDPQPEIPSWVPGNIADEDKKAFAEAAQAAYEADNNTFDFKGRTYKITEKLVGNQDKLDVNGNGKIDAEDLAKLRAGEKPVKEHNLENEVETPGQTQYPGSTVKDVNGNGRIDGEDKPEMPEDDEDEAPETVKEGEEEKYYSKKSNPMSRERQSYASRSHGDAEKATNTANELSRKAYKTNSPEDHKAASDAFKKASSAHSNIGNHADADSHHLMAGIHARKAGLKENAEQNPTDKITIDVPAMIRALEKSREDFKSDEDIHNFVQDLLKKKDTTIDTNALPKNEALDPHADAGVDMKGKTCKKCKKGKYSETSVHDNMYGVLHCEKCGHETKRHISHIPKINEILDPHADAGVWIKDFIASKDPKFAGKSAEERKQQALAAWYQARRDAGIKESTQVNENVAGDTRASDLTTKANQASALAHSTPVEAGALKDHDAAAQAHQHAADHYRVYAHHAGDPVLKSVADIHHKFHSDMAHYHTMRGVNLSMNEGAPADAKGGPEVMDPLTQATKDDHDDETKVEEAPYTNKADGSENVVPAVKPAPKPTPTPKLTQKESTTMSDPIKSIRNVADAYRSMNFSEATTAGSKVQAAHAAADAAWEATSKAEKSGSEEDHMNAFKAHAHAIEKHNEAGRHDTAELHQNKAEYHRGFTTESTEQVSEAYSDGSHLSDAEKNHPATKAAMKASSDAETASKGLNMKKVSQPNYDDHLKHHAALGHHQWAADRHSDAAEAHPAGSRARQYHVSQMKHHDSRAQQHVKATAGSRAGYRNLVARNQ